LKKSNKKTFINSGAALVSPATPQSYKSLFASCVPMTGRKRGLNPAVRQASEKAALS
jgi:hypothetical protein